MKCGELRNCELTNSLYNNCEQVMTRHRSSLHKYKSCKRGRIAWMFPANFQEIESNYSEKKYSRSQSTSSCSMSSIHAKPRRTLATWYMEFVWTTWKRCWQSMSDVRIITDTLTRNSSLCESKCHRCNPSASQYRASCRERWRTN